MFFRWASFKTMTWSVNRQSVLTPIIVFVNSLLEKVYLRSGDQKQSHGWLLSCAEYLVRKIAVQISTIVLIEYLEYRSHNRCFSRGCLPGKHHYKKPAPNSSYLLKHGQEGPVGADSKNRRSSYTRKDVGNNGHVGQNPEEGETFIPLVLSSEAETNPLSPVTRKEINSPQFTWIKVRVWKTETTMPRPLRPGHWMQKKSILLLLGSYETICSYLHSTTLWYSGQVGQVYLKNETHFWRDTVPRENDPMMSKTRMIAETICMEITGLMKKRIELLSGLEINIGETHTIDRPPQSL